MRWAILALVAGCWPSEPPEPPKCRSGVSSFSYSVDRCVDFDGAELHVWPDGRSACICPGDRVVVHEGCPGALIEEER